jgi:hypothetical protein
LFKIHDGCDGGVLERDQGVVERGDERVTGCMYRDESGSEDRKQSRWVGFWGSWVDRGWNEDCKLRSRLEEGVEWTGEER